MSDSPIKIHEGINTSWMNTCTMFTMHLSARAILEMYPFSLDTLNQCIFSLWKKRWVYYNHLCVLWVFCVQLSFKVLDIISCMYLAVAGIEPTPCWSTLRSWSRVFWLDEASFRQDVWRSGHTYSITSLTVVVREPPSLLAAAGMASSKMTPRSVVSCEISHKN